MNAVRDLSFEVEADTCYGFLGPNGAGKTTMMKMLYGKCTKGDGSINVLGYDPAKDELSIKYLSGVVPQDNNLDDELDVISNLMVYSRFYALPRKAATSRIIPRLRGCPRASKDSMIGLKMPAMTRATTRTSTTAQRRLINQRPAPAATIRTIVRGATSMRTVRTSASGVRTSPASA